MSICRRFLLFMFEWDLLVSLGCKKVQTGQSAMNVICVRIPSRQIH